MPTREMTEDDADVALLFVTRTGYVKRTLLSEYKNLHKGGIIATQIMEGDALIGTSLVRTGDEVVIVTAQGMAIRFPVEDVRNMGRATRGVRGIKLRDGDAVVGMAVVNQGDEESTLLTICAGGYAKRSAFSDYRTQGRGGLGLRNISQDGLRRNGDVAAARSVQDGDEIMLITEGGKTIRMQVSCRAVPRHGPLDGRRPGHQRARRRVRLGLHGLGPPRRRCLCRGSWQRTFRRMLRRRRLRMRRRALGTSLGTRP